MLGRMRGMDPGGDLVGIGQLPELGGATSGPDGTIRLGGALTISRLARPDDERVVAPLLQAAALATANPGIRLVATLGGNIVDVGAASDVVAALIALDARVQIVRRHATRTVPLIDLWTADSEWAGDDQGRSTSPIRIRADEIIRAVILPGAIPIGWGWQRLTLHGAMDRSAASVAVAIHANGEARVVLTAAADRPIRFPDVERLVRAAASTDLPGETTGSGFAARLRAAAVADLAAETLVTDDRAPAAYRRQVVPVLVERAVLAAFSRARAGSDG